MLRTILDQLGVGFVFDAIDRFPFYIRLPLYVAVGLVAALAWVTLKIVLKAAYRLVLGTLKLVGRTLRGMYRMVFKAKEVKVPVRKAA